jgi:hypothetical protein
MLGGFHTDHGNGVSFFIACMMKQQKRCHRAPAQRKNGGKARPCCGGVAWTCVVPGLAVRTEETPRSQSEKPRRPLYVVPTDSWSCAATGSTSRPFPKRRAHGVRTSGVRLVSDVCYCSLAVVLLCTVPGLGPGGGHGPSGPACGGARAAWDQRAWGWTPQPSRAAGRVQSQEDPS